MVVWITGLPGSGKSSLASKVAARLREAKVACVVLDGDELRSALGQRAGRGSSERDAFYESLAALAALLSRQGLVVLVAATAHRSAYRDRARALARSYLEVAVTTPLEECERRDPKGLFAAARAGEAGEVPGVGVRYEAPAAPDATASGGEDAAAVDRVTALVLSARGKGGKGRVD